MEKFNVNIQSEIGELEAVVLHTPGPEVENMTPKMFTRALYSDILNLSVAREEYAQLENVLKKVTKTYDVKNLLVKVLENETQKEQLVSKVCRAEHAEDYFDYLMELSASDLARVLIEGVPARLDTLTSFLNYDYYALFPLYNFYFMRDASVVVGNNALICKMATSVRVRESMIMEAIFKYNPYFSSNVVGSVDGAPMTGIFADRDKIHLEGGDILIARDDILIIGNGMRTSTQGIDFIINRCLPSAPRGKSYILVQQLPHSPESFIHLDMVFTLLDRDKCMIYEPLIMGQNGYRTIQITLNNGVVENIRQVPNLPVALRKLGMDLEPMYCGGLSDEWNQEREQWHSGANFLTFAPGKVISYARNKHTLNSLSKHGFEIVSSADIVSGKRSVEEFKQCVITIRGAELARGGGGARCMTLPLLRKPVAW